MSAAPTTPTLTAQFKGNKAASLAAMHLFDSGFTRDQLQAIFPDPTPNTPAAPATLILRPETRSAEARSILLQHGADLV